jgi:hypothetical protein
VTSPVIIGFRKVTNNAKKLITVRMIYVQIRFILQKYRNLVIKSNLFDEKKKKASNDFVILIKMIIFAPQLQMFMQ